MKSELEQLQEWIDGKRKELAIMRPLQVHAPTLIPSIIRLSVLCAQCEQMLSKARAFAVLNNIVREPSRTHDTQQPQT